MVDCLAFDYDDLSELGQGDEGTVFAIHGDELLAVKMLEPVPPDLEARLEAMLALAPASWGGDAHDPRHLFLAWPGAGARWVYEDTVSGLVLPRISHDVSLVSALGPDGRSPRQPARYLDWVRMAKGIAYIVERLHEADVVVGDMSPRNILVTREGLVTLVDVDSMQFHFRGRMFPATRFTPEYAPPEYASATVQYTKDGDRFGLAVLLVQILLGGDHPFEGAATAGSNTTLVDNIRTGRNRIASPASLMPVPRQPPGKILPREIHALARRAFSATRERPSAAEWHAALTNMWVRLQTCSSNVNHQFAQELLACPWCAGPDLFPPSAPSDAAPRPRGGRRVDPAAGVPSNLTVHRSPPSASRPPGALAPLGFILLIALVLLIAIGATP
ncbi:protein kinase domain-containing protein [uncultured Ornithinimicrobium sp.]|uniref:protein kinase domain-containing protein n=1 Tax=uncultured Ornithinimicrobium sp. TaxID=259307 RepID=UPI003390116B